MPEGDTIHRLALRFQPLVGEVIEVLALPRKNVREDAYRGRRIERIEARGKNLLIHLEGGVTLRTHLKMHGSFRLDPRGAGQRFASDVVVFLRTAQFDAVCRSAPIAELIRTADLDRKRDAQVRGGLGDLGIDLLGDAFDAEEIARRWHGARQASIAEALLDQSLAAGIGNEWKSELLFIVKTSPFARPGEIELSVLQKLAHEARTRMRINVEKRPRLYPIDRVRAVGRLARIERKVGEGPVSVYERRGEPCYDCKTPIERVMQGEPARSTYYCPGCQPP